MKRNVFTLFLLVLAGLCMGADPSESPLYQAVSKGNLSAVKKLVEAGEDINKGDRWRTTPLERAAEKGNLKIVEYLLSKGAQNPQKAFENAMRERHTKVAKYLIDSGHIDVNKSVGSFYSYFREKKIPFEKQMQNVKDMTSGKINSPYLLVLVEPENYQKMIDFFNINLTDRIDEISTSILGSLSLPDTVDEFGTSILHVAARRNNLDLAAFLLEKKFDVNVLDDNNHTALFYCITSYGPSINWVAPVIEDKTTAKINYVSDMPNYGPDARNFQMRQVRLATLLFDAGINVNQRNKAGWTVLHFAASYSDGLREILIEKGADQKIKTNFGRTAADILTLRKR